MHAHTLTFGGVEVLFSITIAVMKVMTHYVQCNLGGKDLLGLKFITLSH